MWHSESNPGINTTERAEPGSPGNGLAGQSSCPTWDKTRSWNNLDFPALWLTHSALCAWPRVLQVLRPERQVLSPTEPIRVQLITAVELGNVLGLSVNQSLVNIRVGVLRLCVCKCARACKEERPHVCGKGREEGSPVQSPEVGKEGPLAETSLWPPTLPTVLARISAVP